MIAAGFERFARFVPLIVLYAIVGGLLLAVYLGYYLGVFLPEMLEAQHEGREFEMSGMGTFLGIVGVVALGATVLQILTVFAAPLVMEHDISGMDALRLSARAAAANFWALLGWFLLAGLLVGVAFTCCYLPGFALFPIFLVSHALLYRAVFPGSEVAEVF